MWAHGISNKTARMIKTRQCIRFGDGVKTAAPGSSHSIKCIQKQYGLFPTACDAFYILKLVIESHLQLQRNKKLLTVRCPRCYQHASHWPRSKTFKFMQEMKVWRRWANSYNCKCVGTPSKRCSDNLGSASNITSGVFHCVIQVGFLPESSG